ncbi:MAG: hypothetical protein GY757_14285 [bacterium]|nr:hypothetical protein [bacterium]
MNVLMPRIAKGLANVEMNLNSSSGKAIVAAEKEALGVSLPPTALPSW